MRGLLPFYARTHVAKKNAANIGIIAGVTRGGVMRIGIDMACVSAISNNGINNRRARHRLFSDLDQEHSAWIKALSCSYNGRLRRGVAQIGQTTCSSWRSAIAHSRCARRQRAAFAARRILLRTIFFAPGALRTTLLTHCLLSAPHAMPLARGAAAWRHKRHRERTAI